MWYFFGGKSGITETEWGNRGYWEVFGSDEWDDGKFLPVEEWVVWELSEVECGHAGTSTTIIRKGRRRQVVRVNFIKWPGNSLS